MAGFVSSRDLNSAAMLRARVHPLVTGLDGGGIVIVVIDYGFDLLHPALRTATGETRFAALIDQNGARLQRAEINALLPAADEHSNRTALDKTYDPHANTFGRAGVEIGAHGSWVASIAAGSQTGTFVGVAPKATLIGVHLNLPDSAWREEDEDGYPTWLDAAAQGGEALSRWDGWRSYEASSSIVDALEESHAAACALMPEGIVFNLSIGAWAGGHDHGSKVNRAIETLIETGCEPSQPMTAVVTGTGNAGADAGHVVAAMSGTEDARFVWSFSPKCRAQSKCEIWTDCPSDIAVEIRPRFGDRQAVLTLNGADRGTCAIRTADGQIVGIAENRGQVRNSLRAIRLALHPALAHPAVLDAGRCAFDVAVRPGDGTPGGTVHAWLERDCQHGVTASLARAPGSATVACIDTATLTSIACAPSVISVAGLDNAAADDAVIAMSGRGPRPWPQPGEHPGLLPAPLLAAPASGLYGARSKTNGFMRGSGTSGAAAIVSGASALAMQAAGMAGRRLNAARLAETLLGRPVDLEGLAGWRADLGFGALRFDPSAILSGQIHSRRTHVPSKEKPSDERTLSPPN